MSENKKTKKYSKTKEMKKPIILAKRDPIRLEQNQLKSVETPVQPKILLKTKEKDPPPPQISIAMREHPLEARLSQSPAPITSQLKEREPPLNVVPEQLVAPVPRMTVPITLASGVNFQINGSAAKMLVKTNTDFMVVGVLGEQGVGKSTIMNLLASDDKKPEFCYNSLKDREEVFAVKQTYGPGMGLSTPRTDSVQMFINKERVIFLDTPPLLSNQYHRDGTVNELDDIKQIMFLFTVCHVVIVVHDKFFNLNLIRLLQFAELMKLNHNIKPFISDYLPNIIFVKNKANQNDFLKVERDAMETMIKHFFNDSQLKIFFGQGDKMKRPNHSCYDAVSYFAFPADRRGSNTNACKMERSRSPNFLGNLDILVTQFRNRVFMTPRHPMYNGNTELTEALWFDYLTTATSYKGNFFLSRYEAIRNNRNSDELLLL